MRKWVRTKKSGGKIVKLTTSLYFEMVSLTRIFKKSNFDFYPQFITNYDQITYFHIENDYILPMSPEEKAIIDSNYDEIVVENYDYNQFDYNNHRGPII